MCSDCDCFVPAWQTYLRDFLMKNNNMYLPKSKVVIVFVFVCVLQNPLLSPLLAGDHADDPHSADQGGGGRGLPGAPHPQHPVPGDQHRVQAAHQEGEGGDPPEVRQEARSE